MEAGFTLVEMLVVIGIIAILTLILFVSYQPFKKELALQRAATKMAQDVRRAQEKAVSTEEFNNKIPKGYGIYFKCDAPPDCSRHYVLFADSNGNGRYDGSSEKVEDIYLEKGVVIKNLLDSKYKSYDNMSVLYIPPIPDVSIITRWIAIDKAIITLESNNQEKTIRLNKAGLIYVK
jgi:prepilin-type N-terminal cleavage/methylation domain-containing protein